MRRRAPQLLLGCALLATTNPSAATAASFALQARGCATSGVRWPPICRSAHERAYARCCSENGRCVSVNPKMVGNTSVEQAAPFTHEEAMYACMARGLRLCFSKELRNCCGSGAGLDWAMVWTQDSCTATECHTSDAACSMGARQSVDPEAESKPLHELLLLPLRGSSDAAHAARAGATSTSPMAPAAVAAARAYASCTCHAERLVPKRGGCLKALSAPGEGSSCAVHCRLVDPPWNAVLAGAAHLAPLSEHGNRSVLHNVECNTFDALARLNEMHAGAALSARTGGDTSLLSVGRQRDAWRQLALALEKGQPVNVIALGASMLAGWGCTDARFPIQGNPHCAYANRFVGRLKQYLRAAGRRPQIRFTSLARGGTNLPGSLSMMAIALRSAMRDAPDAAPLLLVDFSVNDAHERTERVSVCVELCGKSSEL